MSPPSRRRGLKSSTLCLYARLGAVSPPSRRRGLKSSVVNPMKSLLVASFAEAWIEILMSFAYHSPFLVASFAEAWIEIVKFCTTIQQIRRLLRGGVD